MTTNPEKDWPHDTRYIKGCPVCGEFFLGPKLAPFCWLDVPEDVKFFWEQRNTPEPPK